jgi:hypothetical protein
MKVATATYFVLMWLLATLYCNNSQSVLSHTLWECHAPTCFTYFAPFKVTSKSIAWYVVNVSNHKVWYNNLNVHILNECSIRNNESVGIMEDTCVFNYACLKCLGDVWNVRILTNHNKSTYNQLINANMKMHMNIKWCYHRMYVSCTHTSTHMLFMLEHVSHSNHFFFHSQFLGGPQLNL